MKDIIVNIQKYFQNWPAHTTSSGNIQWGDNSFTPTDDWIRLDIVSLFSYNKSMQGHVEELYGIYVTIYNSNQTKAAGVLDEMNAFIQNTKIDIDDRQLQVLNYELKNQQMIVGEELYNGLYRMRALYKSKIC